MRHVRCGALNAYIVCGDNPDATAIAARIGRGEPWCFLAFGQIPVDRLVSVDQTRFMALTAVGGGHPKWMAVFDAAERRQISPTVEVGELAGDSKVIVARLGDRVVHLKGSSGRCWSLPDLNALWSCDLPVSAIDDAVERDDGWIVAKGSSASGAANPQAPVVLAISPDGTQIEVHESVLEQGAGPDPDGRRSGFKLSANGRWLERAHDGSVLVTDEGGTPIQNLSALAELGDDQLIDAMKAVWIHGVREIWSAAPIEFHARVVVRSMSLFDALAEKPLLEAVHAQQRLEAAQQRLLDLEREGAVDDELDLVRAEIAYLSKLRNDFSRARSAFKWLVRFAKLAPYDAWQPGDPAFFDRLPQSETRWVKQQFLQPLDIARGAVEAWDAGDQTFHVRFADGCRRSVGLDGALGQLEPAGEAPANGVPTDVKAPAARFLRTVSVATIRLGRLDEYNCVRAIEEIINRIRTGVHKVVWGKRVTLRFALPDGELTEKQFFDFVGANCENAAISLRQLLAAYDEAAKSNDVWSDDGVGAFGYAALALARLDADAYRALDGYFSRRNPREEFFGTDQILPAIAERTNYFGSKPALRFALLRLFEEEIEAGVGRLLAPLIISGARACCTPGGFLREVERIARATMWRSDIEMWAAGGKASAKDIRARMDAAAAAVHQGLVAPLVRAADPLEEWDFAFIAKARRRRSHYPQSALRWLRAWRSQRHDKRGSRARAPASAPVERKSPGGKRARKAPTPRRGEAATPTRDAQYARN